MKVDFTPVEREFVYPEAEQNPELCSVKGFRAQAAGQGEGDGLESPAFLC